MGEEQAGQGEGVRFAVQKPPSRYTTATLRIREICWRPQLPASKSPRLVTRNYISSACSRGGGIQQRPEAGLLSGTVHVIAGSCVNLHTGLIDCDADGVILGRTATGRGCEDQVVPGGCIAQVSVDLFLDVVAADNYLAPGVL